MIIDNIWDMGSELEKSSTVQIPNFCLAKYIVVKLVPPKGKTVRDGLVMTALMLSYTDEEGNEVETIQVAESTNGYDITFPKGKAGLLATKYRGPKSYYRFLNPNTKKFYQIPNDKFTLEYANDYLSSITNDWTQLSNAEKDSLLDEYFEDLYLFGMSNDFAFDNKGDKITIPKPGMVTSFYRRYTPPKLEEKYGNTIITKWPSKRVPAEAGYAALSGEYKEFDEAIALAIDDAFRQKEDPTFDPTSFDIIEDENDD